MMALNLLRTQSRRQINRKPFLMQLRGFKDGGDHATFNDMPIPQGCWKEHHSKAQNRYMMVLLSGLASFIGSCIFVANGKMEFNFSVPDYPYEEEE